MAKNLDNQSPHYEELRSTAGADLVAGDLLTLNEVNIFPLVDVLDTYDYAGIVKSAKVKAAKAVGAITSGAALFWVTANKNVATTGDILIGFANEDVASADTHVNMRFDGTLAYAKL